MVDPDDFVALSELGLDQDQIGAHFRASKAELETMAQDNWQCSAADANDRLRRAGPVSLVARAAKLAHMGDTKLMVFLLEKLWRPLAASPSAAVTTGAADPGTLSNDQLTRIYRIISEGGV